MKAQSVKIAVAVLLLSAPSFAHSQPYPQTLLGWPLAWSATHPKIRVTNYVDHDPLPQTRDFMGGRFTYDGHQGIDICANSFDDQDEGVPVLAAANGIVISVSDDNYDREVQGSNVPGNYVYLGHGDGTTSLYYHLRTHSATVRPGQFVREGQMIGLMGSSGRTTMPHLHFEVAGYSASGGWLGTHDPYAGPFNPLPGLWKTQPEYVGDDHLRVYDLGVTTGSAFSDVGTLTFWQAFKERPAQPVIFGADEPTLRAWVLVSGQVTDTYAIEIRRPDGSLFSHADFNVTPGALAGGDGWQYVDVPFTGHLTPTEYGEWQAQVISGGVAIRTDTFTVGESSWYAPRFRPVGGRSFRLAPNRQEDVLSLSYLGAELPALTFTLENAPANVSLRTDGEGQTIVVIDPALADLAGVPSRMFDVVATDPLGYQGRMHYQLVNPGAAGLGSPPDVTAPEFVQGNRADTIRVDVSATDPDGDAITDLRADLSGLPAGHQGTFSVAPDRRSGRLTLPTGNLEEGEYPVRFTAETALSTFPLWGPPLVQSGLALTRIQITSALAARAFVTGGDRTIRLHSGKPTWCASVEPTNFELGDGTFPIVEMVSPGTGSVGRIRAMELKRTLVADRDANGMPDIDVCFTKEDLRLLLSEVRGRRDVPVTLEGRTTAGTLFTAPLTLDVIAGGTDVAQIAPNPLNPEAVLTIEVATPGPLKVEIFDPQGRRIRTLLDTPRAGAGTLQLRVDAHDDRGRPLASGVYFYRVLGAGATTAGRFAILK